MTEVDLSNKLPGTVKRESKAKLSTAFEVCLEHAIIRESFAGAVVRLQHVDCKRPANLFDVQAAGEHEGSI